MHGKHALQHRRNLQQAGDALPLDQRQGGARIEALLKDDGPTADKRMGDDIAAGRDMADRQIAEDDERVDRKQPVLDGRAMHEIAMGDHRPLGSARGARGIDDQGHVIGLHRRDGGGIGLGLNRPAALEEFLIADAETFALPHDHQAFDAGKLHRQVFQVLAMVPIAQLWKTEEQARLAVPQDLAVLGQTMDGVEPQPNGADPGAGEKDD